MGKKRETEFPMTARVTEQRRLRELSPAGSLASPPSVNRKRTSYCFGYTKKDIERDYLDNTRSLIYEKIVFEKKREDVIARKKILKNDDVWPMSAGWWTGCKTFGDQRHYA